MKRGGYMLADEGMTHQEIADELGISRERVRFLEARALKKLREQFPELSVLAEDETRVNPVIYSTW